MTPEQYIERAKQYLRLSNEHQLEAIFEMFDPKASYKSGNVGAHEGLDAIKAMMKRFFSSFSHLEWMVEDYKFVEPRSVAFDFKRVCCEHGEADLLTKFGHERLDFSANGQIVHIEVAAVRDDD